MSPPVLVFADPGGLSADFKRSDGLLLSPPTAGEVIQPSTAALVELVSESVTTTTAVFAAPSLGVFLRPAPASFPGVVIRSKGPLREPEAGDCGFNLNDLPNRRVRLPPRFATRRIARVFAARFAREAVSRGDGLRFRRKCISSHTFHFTPAGGAEWDASMAVMMSTKMTSRIGRVDGEPLSASVSYTQRRTPISFKAIVAAYSCVCARVRYMYVHVCFMCVCGAGDGSHLK